MCHPQRYACVTLSALAELVIHEDLHIRSQIAEMFLQITNEDRFAWHTDGDGGDLSTGSRTVQTENAQKAGAPNVNHA
eukprot:204839-Prorocentrum_minimum.AAC.1